MLQARHNSCQQVRVIHQRTGCIASARSLRAPGSGESDTAWSSCPDSTDLLLVAAANVAALLNEGERRKDHISPKSTCFVTKITVGFKWVVVEGARHSLQAVFRWEGGVEPQRTPRAQR